jgi:LmbE family N-acetylglucosaminyl deacetylase
MSRRIQAPELIHRSALVLAAHPDDEVLGCGGTLASLTDQGAQVHVAFLADGVSSRSGATSTSPELVERRSAARQACQILGVSSVSFGDFPDNRMDTVALLDVVKSIESLVSSHKPDLVLTHHAGDVNIDHRRIHEAVIAACRPQPGHPVRSVLCFEVASSTEWQLPGSAPAFVPNWFVNISATLEKKLAALQAYAAELRDWPHPRSLRGVEHLARWRGASVGVDAAEAFVLGRHLS